MTVTRRPPPWMTPANNQRAQAVPARRRDGSCAARAKVTSGACGRGAAGRGNRRDQWDRRCTPGYLVWSVRHKITEHVDTCASCWCARGGKSTLRPAGGCRRGGGSASERWNSDPAITDAEPGCATVSRRLSRRRYRCRRRHAAHQGRSPGGARQRADPALVDALGVPRRSDVGICLSAGSRRGRLDRVRGRRCLLSHLERLLRRGGEPPSDATPKVTTSRPPVATSFCSTTMPARSTHQRRNQNSVHPRQQ